MTTQPSNNERPYLTAGQVADLFYVSRKTIACWAREGKLPHIRTLGRHRRFPTTEIRELAASLRVDAEEAWDQVTDLDLITNHPFQLATFRDAWPDICGWDDDGDGLPCGYSRAEHER